MSEREMSDEAAMDGIHAILSGTEWSSDTLEEIKQLVEATGRHIEEPDEAGESDNGKG